MRVATDEQCKRWRAQAKAAPRLSRAELLAGRQAWEAWVRKVRGEDKCKPDS